MTNKKSKKTWEFTPGKFLLYKFSDCNCIAVVKTKTNPGNTFSSVILLDGGYINDLSISPTDPYLAKKKWKNQVYGYANNFFIAELQREMTISEALKEYPEYFI